MFPIHRNPNSPAASVMEEDAGRAARIVGSKSHGGIVLAPRGFHKVAPSVVGLVLIDMMNFGVGPSTGHPDERESVSQQGAVGRQTDGYVAVRTCAGGGHFPSTPGVVACADVIAPPPAEDTSFGVIIQGSPHLVSGRQAAYTLSNSHDLLL